ncbi:hypothetical protein V3L56_001997, partial [Neisseria gonorrhoeae]
MRPIILYQVITTVLVSSLLQQAGELAVLIFADTLCFLSHLPITAARCLAKRLLIAVFRPPILSAHPRK